MRARNVAGAARGKVSCGRRLKGGAMGADLSVLDDVGKPQVGPDGKPVPVYAPLDAEAIAEAKADLELGQAMLRGYFERYRDELPRMKVHSIERKVIIPTRTPKGGVSTAWAEAVVMDLVFEWDDGRLMVMDHKSYERGSWTSASKILMINKQPTSYWRALKEVMGRHPDGHITNVLIKDAPKPPRVLKSGALSCAKDQGTTAALYEEAMGKVDWTKLKPKDMEEAKAFLAWLKAQPPREYFARVTTPRTQEQLAAFDEDDRALMQEMLKARPIRNESWSICPSCDFAGLCPNDTPEARMNFEKRDGVDKREQEFEMIGIKKLGKRNVISHSRRECYLKCRMQHWFRYLEGLKPTLRPTYFDFGDFIHRALAVWYGLPVPILVVDSVSEAQAKEQGSETKPYPGRDDVAQAIFVGAFLEGFQKRYGVSFAQATAPAPAGF